MRIWSAATFWDFLSMNILLTFWGHLGDINLMTLMTRRFIFWKKRLQFGMFIVHFYPPNQSPEEVSFLEFRKKHQILLTPLPLQPWVSLGRLILEGPPHIKEGRKQLKSGRRVVWSLFSGLCVFTFWGPLWQKSSFVLWLCTLNFSLS